MRFVFGPCTLAWSKTKHMKLLPQANERLCTQIGLKTYVRWQVEKLVEVICFLNLLMSYIAYPLSNPLDIVHAVYKQMYCCIPEFHDVAYN